MHTTLHWQQRDRIWHLLADDDETGYAVACYPTHGYIPTYEGLFLGAKPVSYRQATACCLAHYHGQPEAQARAGRSVHGETCLEYYPPDRPLDRLTPQDRLHVTEWTSNDIVASFSTLLGALLKSEAGHSGVQYVVVGSGESSWDSGGVPDPTTAQEDMVSELGRVQATVTYLDNANNTSLQPTNRIHIAGVFGPTQANGQWREWGVVGGNATQAADSGYLIDYQTEAVVTKTSSFTLSRRVRLTF